MSADAVAGWLRELDARVEFQILRHSDPQNKALGYLSNDALATELAAHFDRDGAVEREVEGGAIETRAGCHDELTAIRAKLNGTARGTWLIIERFHHHPEDGRIARYHAVMSRGWGRPHEAQPKSERPTYDAVRASMVSTEVYDARRRVEENLARKADQDLRGNWPVGTVLKGLRTTGQSFSTGIVTDMSQDGIITIELTKRGSAIKRIAKATHLQVKAMIEAHAEIEKIRRACSTLQDA